MAGIIVSIRVITSGGFGLGDLIQTPTSTISFLRSSTSSSISFFSRSIITDPDVEVGDADEITAVEVNVGGAVVTDAVNIGMAVVDIPVEDVRASED